MPNLTHLLIIYRSPEHHHEKDCVPASNQIADELQWSSGLVFISIEYWLIYDENFIKIGVFKFRKYW